MQSTILIPQNIQNRSKAYCSAIQDIMGVDVFDEHRTLQHAIARMIVAYALRQTGVSYSDCARLLHKTHPTIIYYEEKMKTVLTTPGYEAEREIWKKFKERI